jgi:hypothetical protein
MSSNATSRSVTELVGSHGGTCHGAAAARPGHDGARPRLNPATELARQCGAGGRGVGQRR